MVALNCILWARLHMGFGYCDIKTITLEKGNFEAVLQRECSDRGCIERVVIRRWLCDTEIFVYEPPGSDPGKADVAWSSPDELKISLGEVSHIWSQKTEARGVKITYQIGKVDDPYQ
ncbi:MAG TPA: hypothetical protein VEF34_03695 [Syntrophobacteraceae bacterium]|nr:hypothetical protein [Syntrophobacteraceae bacterium]